MLRQVKRDSIDIAERLSGFEDAWHLVRLACSTLLESVDMADTVSVSNPSSRRVNEYL